MTILHRARKGRGFTLVEIMITLGIFGAALAVVLYYQQRTATMNKATDMTRAITTQSAKIKTYFGVANDYSGATAANITSMNIVPKPMTISGSTVLDAWGNTMSYVGGTSSYIIQFGGGSSGPDAEACTAIASAFTNSATAIYIGTSQTTTSGVLGGSSAATLGIYKTSGGTISTAELAKGCAIASTVISLQFN